MATLILTAVGSAIGGPVGGALGAMIGGRVDGMILGPRRRTGPRLDELQVQLSTFGTAIPAVYGTMRVAGSVIWSTDLIERRGRQGGGKGQPSTRTYVYSVSLAVALSSRRVERVGRIWADGRLLRGAAGDFKSRCAMRLYVGDADQPVDPLIAGAIGEEYASAHRGISYAVLEDLDLTDFGNRIPSLTFEVTADAGTMAFGEVAADLCRRAGTAEVEFGGGGPSLAGYAAEGERVRDAIAPLAGEGDLMLSAGADRVRIGTRGSGTAVALDAVRSRALAATPVPVYETRRAGAGVPHSVTVRHHDPARDWQTGQQRALSGMTGGRDMIVDLPAALDAAAALSLARGLALRAVRQPRTARWTLDWAALATMPGNVIRDAAGRDWLVQRRTVGADGVTLDLVPPAPAPPAAADADPGVPVSEGDTVGGPGHVRVLDLPVMDARLPDHAVLVAAGGGASAGWRGADLWWKAGSDSEPEPLGRLVASPALGVLAAPVAAGAGGVIDTDGVIEVTLAGSHMQLADATTARLLSGANLAQLGGEIIQFGRAEPVGEGRWRVSRLIRARFGTEDAAGPHAAGTPFTLIDADSLMAIGPLVEDGGPDATVEWLAQGETVMQSVAVPVTHRALQPLAPCHLDARRTAGGLVLSWVPRSRVDWWWRDAATGVADENMLLFAVELTGASGRIVRDVNEPALALTPVEFAALGAAPIAVAIRQRGARGMSPPLTRTIPAAS